MQCIGVAMGGPYAYWAMALPKISIMGVAVVINWSLIIAITTTRTPTETIVENQDIRAFFTSSPPGATT